MTLKQLEAFYWAATCSSFLVASERVHLTVSSLSKRIAELEASLGVELFDRSKRSAELTVYGQNLLPRIQELLRAAADVQQAAVVRPGLRGRCRIGMGELSGITWLPSLVAMARNLHPDLMLEPTIDVGESLERRLRAGELDFVVVAVCRRLSEGQPPPQVTQRRVPRRFRQ